MSHAQSKLDLRDLDFLSDQPAATVVGGIAANSDMGCYYSPQPPLKKCFPTIKYDGCTPKPRWEILPVGLPKL